MCPLAWPIVILPINILMHIDKQHFLDPDVKESMKNKIAAEIEKMKIAQSKGDKQAEQKIMILNQRIRLIDSCRPLNDKRISALQKVFRHYCQNRNKPHRPMSFDQITFQYDHMTIERFFTFINDFKLNEIPTEQGNRELTDKNNIILIFKKTASHVRLISFSQFIIAVQRLFVLLFNETENYDRKRRILKAEKKKRLENMKKRQLKKKIKKLLKQGKLLPPKDSEKGKQAQKAGESQSSSGQQESSDEQQPSNNQKGKPGTSKPPTKNPQPKQEPKKKEEKKSGKETPVQSPPQKPKEEEKPPEPKSTENDGMVKEMMKDFQIVNPQDEVKKAVQEVNKSKGKEDDDDEVEVQFQFDPYAVSDEQKIQSYMLRIGIDKYSSMASKMRNFSKANHKYDQVDEIDKAMEVKKSKLSLFKKDQLTHYQNGQPHEEWSRTKKASQGYILKRMKNIKDILSQRDLERSKSHMAEAIPNDKYEMNKKKSRQSFQKRQKVLMDPMALARLTKMKQQEQQNNVHYSLEMIHRSTPNQLPLGKINPERYAVHDPSDRIFLQQFSVDTERAVRGLAPRGDMSLVESTKRRAKEIEAKQTKKLDTLAENKFKNPHYLQKFLSRKW